PGGYVLRGHATRARPDTLQSCETAAVPEQSSPPCVAPSLDATPAHRESRSLRRSSRSSLLLPAAATEPSTPPPANTGSRSYDSPVCRKNSPRGRRFAVDSTAGSLDALHG